MIIRCSSLGKIMTNPKKKTEVLSKGAKTYIKELVVQELFDYKTILDSKYCDKGIEVEDISIDLYNEVNSTLYLKNTERLTNDWITGECDINTGDKIIDIKSSWSLETFPATSGDIDSKLYEWQLRGYMMLYNKEEAELAYCMVNTPPHLLKDWDYYKIHVVDRIDPTLRVTKLGFERDLELEEKIKEKVEAAREFAAEYRNEILNK